MSEGFSIQGRPQSVVLVFFLGVVISAAAFYVTRQEEEKRIRAEFERRAEVQHAAFREQINRYQELLRTTRSYMIHSQTVSRQEFRDFSAELMSRYAGIQALEWVPQVPGTERAAFEAAARRDGHADFEFKDYAAGGPLTRSPARKEYFPIYYVEPYAGNEAALGLDLVSRPTLAKVLQARDSGRVVATEKFKLVQESGDQTGWVMFLAVYQTNLPPAAGVAQRRQEFRGCVEGVFRVEDLMTAIWQKAPFAGLDTLVLDGSAAASNRFFYFHAAPVRKEKLPPPDEAALRSGVHHEIKSQLVGRDWVFLIRPAPEWLAAQYTDYPYVILLAGILFSALMAAYFRTIARRTVLVEQLVTERTSSLRVANEQLEKEIAERKHAEAERARYQSEREEIFERLQLTLNHMPAGCILNDAEFKFTYWNPAAERIFGYRFEEVRGRHPFASITPASSQAAVGNIFERLKAGEQTANAVAENLTKDGRVILCEWSNAPLRHPDGTFMGILSMCQDVTERHKAEAERQEMDRNLQETQKLESLGVLAGGIAHDFNNLLTGILGNASLARMELPPGSPINEYLVHVEVASSRAADLCRQMLAYSGKGRFVVEKVNLSIIVQETTHLLELSISKKATLKFNLTRNLPAVLADVTQMRQIIMNLVINASEAVGDHNGLISISSGVTWVDRAYLADTFLAPDLPAGDYVYLEVEDNGSGMSPQTQARIFEPFFTTKFTGRGLGLAAVLGIVRGHKGTLKVESEAGRGTTFRILLPCADSPAEKPPAAPARPDLTRGIVLVVDDEETVRVVVAKMLETMGFKALMAFNGRDALEKYRIDSARIVLVLLDLTMPQLDGVGTFHELRRRKEDVRVILMSGFNEQDAINGFEGKGLKGFLQKPFGPDALREKIEAALKSPGEV